MSNRFSRTTSWIVDKRWLNAICLILFSAVSIGGYCAPDSVVAWFKSIVERQEIENPDEQTAGDLEEDDEIYVAPPEVETLNMSQFDAVMVVESDSFFTPAGAAMMRDVVDRLEDLDHVADVLWMDKIPTLNLFGLNEPLLPRATSSLERFKLAQQKAREHPLVNGQLLSEDGKTLLLLIRVDFLFIEDDAPFSHELREFAESVAAKHKDVEVEFCLTGGPSVFLMAMKSHEDNQLKYQIIAYTMILLMSMVLFRGITAVGVVALAPVFGVFWTMGFIRYFEFQLNPFNDVVLPVLVALVGFTDGVHLMVQIRKERASGLSVVDSAKEGLRKVGLACFLTSLTTAVGFGSLALANNELVREFGYCCVIGVVLSFIAVILTIPLACSTWLGQRIHRGHGRGYIDQNIGRVSLIVEFVLKHRRWVSIVGIVASISFFACSLTLRPDERAFDILPPSSEPATALKKMDRAMGGLEQVNINLEWSRKAEKEQGETAFLGVLQEIDELLKSEPLVGHPISIYNLLDSLPGDGRVEDRASMLELLPPELKRTYYTPERRQATISFRCRDLGVARYSEVFQRLDDELTRITEENDGFKHRLNGLPIWRWKNIYQIVVDLATSLGTAAIIIFLILSVVYRSLRIGIISILPNLFPLCVAGTFLVLTGQNLEIVTVCAFTCCLGIAVDDTIHFLTRYVEEKKQVEDESEAIRHAFTAVGTALVMTTLVLVSGFLTVLFSEAREHRIFASMGAITVAAALFGDLVFLPAILARFGTSKKAEKTD